MDHRSLQEAFVLHSRPYRETSLIVDLYCKEAGRLSAVARGGRAKKGSAVLQPFQDLLIAVSGSSELKTLTQVESIGYRAPLKELALYSGFYLNELILKLLPTYGGPSGLYSVYQQALEQLSKSMPLEPVLRSFELSLLEELGLGIEFGLESLSGLPVKNSGYYLVSIGDGVSATVTNAVNAVSGSTLLAIQQRLWQDPRVLSAAKMICRQLIKQVLEGRSLQSRKVLQQYIEVQRD